MVTAFEPVHVLWRLNCELARSFDLWPSSSSLQTRPPSVKIFPEANVRMARAARQHLEAFHGDIPQDSHIARKLHIVYWTPADREPAADYTQRLTRVLKHIQDFYADQMEANGFGRRTIGLDLDAEGLLRIHLVKGQGKTSEYGRPSGAKIRQECLPVLRAAGIRADRETIVIFCNLGFWDERTRRMRHRSPYYAGGNNVSGTAWQLDEPILDTLRLTDSKPMFDGEYGRISMGRHNTIFIGGVAHELGHALSLPHNRERGDQRVAFGTALMGSGNRTYGEEQRGEGRGSFLTFASALRLASHPQFSGSTREMNRPVQSRTSTTSEWKRSKVDFGYPRVSVAMSRFTE